MLGRRLLQIAFVAVIIGLLALVGTTRAQAPADAPAAAAIALPLPVGRDVGFTQDIHAILAENCASCHMQGKRKGALSMDSRENLLQGGDTGPAFVDGNSAESLMIKLVAGQDPDRIMPPKGRRLTEQEIALLRAWIDQGAKWDLAASHQEYVAPLKLQPVAPPALAERPSENLVDRFVVTTLLQRSQAEPATVDDAVFARRVYFDLGGLPPTPDELRAFLADAAADKRAKLIETLLADQQRYAEHWMSFWNDLLRNDYEGPGYIDGGRKQITDWLYGALHDNKPYDQFVRELISPVDGSEGFIKGIVWRGDNAAVQTPPLQAARNLAQVFTGINLKCASCHDSFIDHWQLADAYALANCFSDAPLELIRCDVPLGKQASFGFLWPELGTVDGALPREQRMARIAELTTSKDNGHFARTIVNRLWALFLGRGLVEPLDVIESKPWHPELLDTMAQDLIDHGWDLKHTMRLILNSRVYQWPSVRAGEQRGKDFQFDGPEVRRLSGEMLYDTISQLTGVWHINSKFMLPSERTPAYAELQKKLDEASRNGLSALIAAGQDVPIENYYRQVRAWRTPNDTLMMAMGRPNREQVTTRRESAATTLQALEMSNGDTLSAQLRRGAAAIIAKGPKAPADLVNDLYLHGVQRFPTSGELETAVGLLGNPVTQEGLEDFLWALAMTPDFQFLF